MATIDIEFHKLCNEILTTGREYENKNRGVKRLQIPSYTFRHNLANGFPAITSKKLPFKTVVGELIWFLRGDNDVKFLNDNKIPIWNKDAYNWYCKFANKVIDRYHDMVNKHSFNKIGLIEIIVPDFNNVTIMTNQDGEPRIMTFEEFSAQGTGSVGQNYSKQWRSFNGKTDQIADLITGMKTDIMSSRLKVNAWNPSEIDETALPPCHSEFQVIGVPLSWGERVQLAKDRFANRDVVTDEMLDEWGIPKFGFELHWNQRSVDVFLGLPFNIASYALLAHILEDITGYPAIAIEGTLKCVHFYDNQYDAAKELVKRDPNSHSNSNLHLEPKLINQHFGHVDETNLNTFFDFLKISDFELKNYTHDPEIKVEMLAPKQ